jgi:hypothetical protein
MLGGSSPANVADIRSRLGVVNKTVNPNSQKSGSGLDLLRFKSPKENANHKPGDVRN